MLTDMVGKARCTCDRSLLDPWLIKDTKMSRETSLRIDLIVAISTLKILSQNICRMSSDASLRILITSTRQRRDAHFSNLSMTRVLFFSPHFSEGCWFENAPRICSARAASFSRGEVAKIKKACEGPSMTGVPHRFRPFHQSFSASRTWLISALFRQNQPYLSISLLIVLSSLSLARSGEHASHFFRSHLLSGAIHHSSRRSSHRRSQLSSRDPGSDSNLPGYGDE